MKKYSDFECIYCGWVLKNKYPLSFKTFKLIQQREQVISNHIRAHQDEGVAPNKGREREVGEGN